MFIKTSPFTPNSRNPIETFCEPQAFLIQTKSRQCFWSHASQARCFFKPVVRSRHWIIGNWYWHYFRLYTKFILCGSSLNRANHIAYPTRTASIYQVQKTTSFYKRKHAPATKKVHTLSNSVGGKRKTPPNLTLKCLCLARYGHSLMTYFIFGTGTLKKSCTNFPS